jgi:hypothetical protein
LSSPRAAGRLRRRCQRDTFIDRARGLVALSHPNIITVFDVGEHDGRI